MLKLEHNEHLKRRIRLDDITTIGTSTYRILEDLIAEDADVEAGQLADYYHRELRIMHDILMTWGQDIVRFLVARDTGVSDGIANPISTAICKAWWDFEFGIAPLQSLQRAISARDQVSATVALERLWLEFKIPHDVLVAWINEMLGYLARETEEDVLNSVLETHQSIWGDRYESWDRMSPWEKVGLTVEGMRGHLSGASRKGDVKVVDEGDRFAISFDPCGTGGVLRRGDPETGRTAYMDASMSEEPHEWVWDDKTNIHWYCAHCAIAMEWLPGRKRGHPLRPLDHSMDHDAPCVWYVYKEESNTRDYHYPRTGLSKPST
jgi:hypothetical protein